MTIGVLDKRLARKYERQLAADVRFAFSKVLGGDTIRIVPNLGVRFPPGFDYAYVTLKLENFFLRFIRGRGEFGVLVAPEFSPMDWHDLSLLLGIVRKDPNLRRSEFRDVWHVARSLEAHLKEVVLELSEKRFADVKKRLQSEVYSYEQFAKRQWETEINIKLYGSSHDPME